MLKCLLPLVIVLSLAGCSSNSQSQYIDQVQSSNSTIAHSFHEAILHSQATPLPINRGLFPKRWEISAAEPRIVLGEQIGNYRLFNFRLLKGQTYVINVSSMCNNMCMGFAKNALKPKAVVLDAQGNIVADNLDGPNALAIEWSGVAPADGTYFLLIAADNRALGEQVSVINTLMPGYPGVNMPIGMASAPFGKVIAYVEFPNEP
ncbi:hypothetical protein [Pseudomonas sp. LB1P83]